MKVKIEKLINLGDVVYGEDFDYNIESNGFESKKYVMSIINKKINAFATCSFYLEQDKTEINLDKFEELKKLIKINVNKIDVDELEVIGGFLTNGNPKYNFEGIDETIYKFNDYYLYVVIGGAATEYRRKNGPAYIFGEQRKFITKEEVNNYLKKWDGDDYKRV